MKKKQIFTKTPLFQLHQNENVKIIPRITNNSKKNQQGPKNDVNCPPIELNNPQGKQDPRTKKKWK